MSANGAAGRARRRNNLRRLLDPKSVVFLGGSQAASAIRTCRTSGYGGQIFAVSRTRDEIEGVQCRRSLMDLPVVPDAAFVAVPADGTIEAVTELASMGAGGAICYASGFSELGAIGNRRNAALVQGAGDMALVGPNCFGLINYVNHASLWTVPYPKEAGPRGAAVVGQSGNTCINISMNQREVPFSYIISVGNQAVLGFEDYIETLIDDPNVTAVGLVMEGLRDVRSFSEACLRALSKGIPIVAFRVGVSELGAKLATSHTSSLAGRNELYDALFDRLGILPTRSIPQFLEMLKTASLSRQPRGRRLAVFSSSGGDNGMAADFGSAAGLALPQPNERQRSAVKAMLPDYGQVSNPLDFTAGYWGAEDLLIPMFTDMLSEGYDQGLLVIDHPRPELGDAVGKPLAAMVRALGRASRASGLPATVACVNPESMPSAMRRHVIEEGLLPLQGLDDACEVLGLWAAYAERAQAVRAGELPDPPFDVGAPLDAAPRVIDEFASKRRLAAYGLPVSQGFVCTSSELPRVAAEIPGPVVLKALHEKLPHKTDVGGVALGLEGGEAVAEAAKRMREAVARKCPDVVLDQFLIEPMQPKPVAELIVGVKRDPLFSLVLVIGFGGTLVELLRDSITLLLPTTPVAIDQALRQLKLFPLLDGFRGAPKADIAATVEAIEAIARYAADARDTLLELDVNPLFLMPAGEGVVAVDALIIDAVPGPGSGGVP